MPHDRAIHQTLKSTLLVGTLCALLSGCIDDDTPEDNPSPVPRFSLSGTVSSAAGSVVDSDVNDPYAPYAPNDTPAQAQPIPNPVMVGGYVNVAGSGNGGRSFFSGDRSDYYRVSLAAGQTITLNIADFNAGDLNLFLYDASDTSLVDSSEGTGTTESLTSPLSGDYVIRVYAYAGSSNYALVVGQDTAPASADRLVLSDDFVPGDIIVRFRDTAQALGTDQARAASLGLRARGGGNGRAMLLTLDGLKSRQALGIASATAGQPAQRSRSADPVKQLKLDTLQAIKALRKRDDVLYAEPNYIRHATRVPTDRYYDLQWHYPLINLPAAWDISTGDANVIVAVIDTGVLLRHPDLAGQFSADGGYDFISDDLNANDGQPGIDDDPNDPGDKDYGGSSFHGTHVAGTVAAATRFSGTGTGVAGVAPGVKIMPLRVLGTRGGSDYDIIQAVRYAAGLSNDSGGVPARKADVINLSLGGAGYSQAAQNAYTAARNAGVVIVAAAGNESTSNPSYPAAYEGVISVSAVDIGKQLAPYSNYGTSIDVAAPGGSLNLDTNGDGYLDGVLSAVGDDSGGGGIDFVYKFYQGTSMAAPHMAGVVALMKSVHGDLTPDDVDNLLSSGRIVEDLGPDGRDNQFGHGLIDALKAVEEARRLATGGAIPDNPQLSVTPASLNFGGSLTRLPLSVTNGGTGTLEIDTVSDDADWLTVSADSVNAAGLGGYQVVVDRSGLSAGTYTATITVTPTDPALPAVTVPVIQQVGAPAIASNAGFHYVLLVDVKTGRASRSQWAGAPRNGEYRFRLDNVPIAEGQRYILLAGTDQNNDGIICDAGEACGVYLSRSQPKTIGTGDSHRGLDFVSGFSIGLQNQSASLIPARGIAIPRPLAKQAP